MWVDRRAKVGGEEVLKNKNNNNIMPGFRKIISSKSVKLINII